MKAIDEDPRLAEGIRLFNGGRYFESHEVLEDLWREQEGLDRELLQGLIQVAVAHLHASRENSHGVKVVAESARRHLENCLPRRCGIDLVEVGRILDRLEGPAEDRGDPPRIEFPPEGAR